MADQHKDACLQDPDEVIGPRARTVGILTVLLFVVVIASFIWYFVVTIPNYGSVREAEQLNPDYMMVSDGEQAPVDPLQGS